jgi:hypothetical protein
MSLLKFVIGLAAAAALTACGGGGGSAGITGTGSTGSGTTGSTTVSGVPTMSLSVVDAVGTEITNHALSQTQAQFLKITLKDSTGAAAPFTRVTVALDSTTAVLVPSTGAQLTDSSGVVLMRIAPASVTSSGPVLATATATVNGVAVTPQTYELQISPGTVGLSALSVSPLTVQSGQSINVGLNVTVNGAAAPSNSVAVDFTSTCGSASPASALVDSTGRATSVVQTSSTGNCVVSASAGGVSMSAPYTVTAPPITGIQFVSAAPDLIYQSGSAGVNTSTVKFKVIDAIGGGVAGVNVNASLTNSDGGINFCGPASPAVSVSGSDGVVTFSVCAGTLPATVQVRAALDAPNSSVFTNSHLLTVQTGLPTQRFFDISATQLNFYAGGYFTSKFNGNSVQISVFSADRQGNPVPDGTKIVFVSEGGQINSSGLSSCLITNGRCSVDLIGQDYRPMGSAAAGGDPRPGRVTVLAYADGEEYFIDANNNNRYDALELFEDLGAPYIDKDESGAFAAAYTNLVTGTNEGEVSYPTPAGATGTSACPVNSNVGLSIAGTCNGIWTGYTKVRREIVIVFSGGEIGQPGFYSPTIPAANQTAVLGASRSAVVVRLADYDGNPLPADASLSVEVIPTGNSSCSATLLGSVIGSTTEPTSHAATLKDCIAGDFIQFKVTVSAGGATKISSFGVSVP